MHLTGFKSDIEMTHGWEIEKLSKMNLKMQKLMSVNLFIDNVKAHKLIVTTNDSPFQRHF